jgi:hypothetical protein
MSALIDSLLSATDPQYLQEKMVKIAGKPASKRVITKTKGVSKIALAMEIFKKHNGNKQVVIAEFVEVLGMSKAGATTYFYNAKKSA